MAEPRGLSLGKSPTPNGVNIAIGAAALTSVAPDPVSPAAPYDMKVAAPVAGQHLVPFTPQEAGEMGKTAGLAVAGIADKITGIARAGDIDEVGKALGGLLIAAKKYDPSSFKKGGGLLGFFKVKVQELKNQFATVDSQVDQLLRETDNRIALFKGRIGDLQALYDENERRYHEVADIIADAEQRILWMEDNLPPVDASDSFSAQQLSDWKAAIDYAKKRVDDLRRVQILCQQQGPQIKLMAQNAGALVMKFGEIKTTTIPVLKNAFALYILNMEQEKGAAFATAIDDLTNETLTRNSKKLGQTTVAVQTSLARSTIDLKTLQETQADTIKALDDVQRIRAEMQTRLQQERPQLEALSQQLAQRLSQ